MLRNCWNCAERSNRKSNFVLLIQSCCGVFWHRSRTSKAHGSTPLCGRRLSGLCMRSACVQTNEEWHARLNRKAVSAQLPLYKLIDLLYREARITDVTMKMLCDTKQQRLQSKSSAHVQHKLSVLAAVSLRGRPSAGVFPHVFVSLTVFCVTLDSLTEYADSLFLPKKLHSYGNICFN